MIGRVVLRPGTYRDSITLMKTSNRIGEMNGISQAAIVMATPLNKKYLRDAGFRMEGIERAVAEDLLIAIEGDSEENVQVALGEVDRLLSAREATDAEQVPPRTLDSALRMMPDANLAVISVPGIYAKRETLRALRKDLNVFLFSSGLSVEDELELKRTAATKHLLMMGPDCGTAIINNVVLGFGNIVHPGSIGIVSASGTGVQQVSTLIDREGLGISQAIGTGGNDLSETVGGVMTLEGLRRLDGDAKTRVIILISKPPSPAAEGKLLREAARSKKPVVLNFLGAKMRERGGEGPIRAATLEDAARMACTLARGEKPTFSVLGASKDRILALSNSESRRMTGSQRYVRGLFSGGTLCYEAQLLLTPLIGRVHANIPLRPADRIKNAGVSKAHTCIDMGAEEFTVGRAHPMIDFTLRQRRILQEARDPEVAVLLLDVVLGLGSHRDPAGELVPWITEAKGLVARREGFLSVVASIVGTLRDPQNLREQQRKLKAAGVTLMPTNAQAARIAGLIASRGAGASQLLKEEKGSVR